VESGGSCLRTDQVATEEPLEIRLRAAGIAEGAGPLPVFRRRSECAGRRTVAITMRTPGADFELAAGFLYGEGIIRSGDEIRGISHCEEPDLDEHAGGDGFLLVPPPARGGDQTRRLRARSGRRASHIACA
jgi:FdhD protein